MKTRNGNYEGNLGIIVRLLTFADKNLRITDTTTTTNDNNNV